MCCSAWSSTPSRSPSILQARSNSQELHNASIAIVDEDNSALSRRIAHAFLPPLFQPPRDDRREGHRPADEQRDATPSSIDIPPNFQRDVLAPTPARAPDRRRCDRDGAGGPRVRLCAADRHDRDRGFPLRCGGRAAVDASISTCGSRSTRTSRPRGSPA